MVTSSPQGLLEEHVPMVGRERDRPWAFGSRHMETVYLILQLAWGSTNEVKEGLGE